MKDLLDSARDRIVVSPAIGITYGTLYAGELFGFTHEIAVKFGMQRILDDNRKAYKLC